MPPSLEVWDCRHRREAVGVLVSTHTDQSRLIVFSEEGIIEHMAFLGILLLNIRHLRSTRVALSMTHAFLLLHNMSLRDSLSTL